MGGIAKVSVADGEARGVLADMEVELTLESSREPWNELKFEKFEFVLPVEGDADTGRRLMEVSLEVLISLILSWFWYMPEESQLCFSLSSSMKLWSLQLPYCCRLVYMSSDSSPLELGSGWDRSRSKSKGCAPFAMARL